MSDKIYSHVLRYTSLFGGVQAFNMLMSFVRNKVVAVLLGSVGIGLIDLYNRTTSFLTSITTLIAPVASVRALSQAYESGDRKQLDEQVKVVRSWSLLTAIAGFFLCIALSPLISRFTFGDSQHVWRIIVLSPIIICVAISGSELSVLKATRRLRRLAWSSFCGALALAAVSIPFYFVFGTRGIVPALVVSTFAVSAINLSFSVPLHPWHVSLFSVSLLRKGGPLVRLSVMYILAGIVASASELFIRSSIVSFGKVADVGLYSAGMLLSVAAARFLFVAMDADYFPRLSACCNYRGRMLLAVNRQLEVCVLLLSPFLIIFNLFMPQVVQLLFAPSFLQVVPMAILASFYIFFKAVTTPLAYLPLAHGDGWIYFIMETVYYVVFCSLVITFYHEWNFLGAGIALSLSNILENIFLSLVYHRRYRFVYSRRAQRIILMQGVLVVLGIFFALCGIPLLKYAGGTVAFGLSLIISLRLFTLVRGK